MRTRTTIRFGLFVAALLSSVPCTLSAVEFSEFTIEEARVRLGRGRFEIRGRLALGAGSDGIDPLNEDVTVMFGPVFQETIPAGSFVRDDDDEGFQFDVDDVSGVEQVDIRDDEWTVDIPFNGRRRFRNRH